MKRYTALNPSGQIIVLDPEAPGGIIEHDTVHCVHCGRHWRVNPKNAKGTGFCGRCNGPICGKKCIRCVPRERQLEEMEGTVSESAVSVGGKLWLPGI